MAHMSLAQHVGLSSNWNSSSLTITFGTQPTNGNLLVVLVAVEQSPNATLDLTTTAVADNKGNTFTRAVASPVCVDGSTHHAKTAIYYLVVPGTYTGYTVTVTPSNIGSFAGIDMDILELSGQNATPGDVTASNQNNSSVNPAPSGTTATTAGNCELLVAVCALGAGTFTWDTASGWTSAFADSGSGLPGPAQGRYKLDNSANNSIAASTSWTVNSGSGLANHTACIAAFDSSQSVVTAHPRSFSVIVG